MKRLHADASLRSSSQIPNQTLPVFPDQPPSGPPIATFKPHGLAHPSSPAVTPGHHHGLAVAAEGGLRVARDLEAARLAALAVLDGLAEGGGDDGGDGDEAAALAADAA